MTVNRCLVSGCPRVDHLYGFFVQWSPDVYGKEAREQGFVVVDEMDMVDNFFSDPASCSWEVDTPQHELPFWFGPRTAETLKWPAPESTVKLSLKMSFL